MTKKKVLFVGSFKELGGSGNVGGQMFACKSLIESSLSDKVDWTLVDSTADSNISNPLLYRILKAFKRILIVFYNLAFKKVDIALIFTSNGFSFLEKGTIALLAKLFGVKVILAPRSGFIIQDFENAGFMKLYITYVFKKVDFVICQGKKWQSYFSINTGVSKEKLIIVQNWINLDKYCLTNNPQGIVNILFLGWVDKNKGIHELIESLVEVDKKYNYILNIAGDGAAMKEIKPRIDELGLTNKIKIHGWVTGMEKMSLLTVTDIFVLPSYYEGFPNALLEAMASGIACIATNVGSVADLISDKENGLVIRVKNVHSLSQALNILLSNPELRSKLGTNARKTSEINNSLESAVIKFSTLFNLS